EALVTRDWLLEPDADWHGFGHLAEDYVLLDPIKVTLVTPGLTAAGRLSERGIPAAVVSKFLWERGLVVEKTGLYSILVLFSMGITKGKWSTLLTELLEFKRHYDNNVSLCDALPAVASAGGQRGGRRVRRHGARRSLRRAACLSPRKRHCQGGAPHVYRLARTGDETGGCLRQAGAWRGGGGAYRAAGRAYRGRDAGAISAGNSIDHAGRAIHLPDALDCRLP